MFILFIPILIHPLPAIVGHLPLQGYFRIYREMLEIL